MSLVTFPRQFLVDANGSPRVGAKAYFYQAGTTTPITTYNGPDFATPNTNPVLSVAGGLFPEMHVDSTEHQTYKLVIKDANDAEIYSGDNISALSQPPGYERTEAEILAGVTPTDLTYPAIPALPERYGAVGDGETDDTTALQAWAAVAAPRALGGKTYKCNDRLIFPKHATVIGQGSGRSVIDLSGADGSFTGNQSMSFTEGELVALPATSDDPDEGDTQITFASAHGLAEGDIFFLHNDTAGSWSGHNDNFTAGEACIVSEVVSSTVVGLLEPLYDSYTSADTDAYKLDYGTFHLEGFSVKGVSTDSGVIPILISHCAHSRLRDVKVTGTAGTAITIRYSVDIEGSGLTAHQYYEGTEVGTSQYGVSIIHCQDVRLQGNFQGERHAVTTGSSSSDGGIVNRNILVHDSQLKSLIDCAGDFHGNTEYSSFDNCTLNGGVALGGDNCYLRNSLAIGNSAIHEGQPIRFREMLGFNFEIANVHARTLANPVDDGGTGVIDVGGNNTTTLTADTVRGGMLRISNLYINAPSATSGIRFANRGCTEDLDVVINGLTVNIDATTTSQFGYLRLDNLSGGNFRSLSLDGVSNPDRIPLSSTMDVDDAPSGSFTPTLTFGGGSTGLTYSHQVGEYEVNRDTVTGWGSILLTAKGSSTGAAAIGGLPFTCAAKTNLAPVVSLMTAEVAFTGNPAAIVNQGAKTIALQESDSAGSISTLTDADFEDTSRIRFTFSYRRA